MAVLAGININDYIEASWWKRVFLDEVTKEVLKMRGAIKQSEVNAITGAR